MALDPILDSAESIPEGLTDHYSQRDDGKFVLNVNANSGMELSDTSALKSALSKERSAAQDAAKRLKAFEGLDAQAARDALSKVQEIAEFNPEQKVEEAIKAREKQIFAKHASEIDVVKNESNALRTQLSDTLVTSAAAKAIANSKGSVDLLLPHVLRNTRMRQNDAGQFVVEVIDGDGNQRIGDAQGNPMTIPQLVDEMRASETFSRAFEASGAAGTGATGSSPSSTPARASGSKTISRSDFKSMNASLEQIASGEITVVD